MQPMLNIALRAARKAGDLIARATEQLDRVQIETKGEIAHGSMPFLGDCAVRHMGAVLHAFETELYPALDSKETRMPVVPEV